ncbi:19653_t:CDS:2, partial [Entrophospora sp. SA101]
MRSPHKLSKDVSIYPDMERLDYFESLIDRFLQGNNPNSLIYVERTWGNY